MNAATTDVTPWYRQFWPWVLLGIPASSVLYCAVFITMALTTENSLVSDDYYKDGLAINKRIERDLEASRRGLSAEYRMAQSDRLTVTLLGSGKTSRNTLILRLIHPTIASRDELVRLSRVEGSRFEVHLSQPLYGNWYLDLRDPSNEWRLYGAAQFPSEQPIHITPQTQGG